MKTPILLIILSVLQAVVFAGSMIVNIPLDPAQISVVDRGVCTSVTHPEGYTIYSPGVPDLPVVPVQVALPTGCRAVGFEVVEAGYATLDGSHYITPSSGCFPISRPELALPAEPDAHIYGHDRFYPSVPVMLNSSSVVWGIPVAYLTVFPARWNPAPRAQNCPSVLVKRLRSTPICEYLVRTASALSYRGLI